MDENRNEQRKIEIFRDRKVGYATSEVEFGGSGLSEYPLPKINEIVLDYQFKATEISKVKFEQVWSKK